MDALRILAAAGFPLLIALAVGYLVHLDRRPDTSFRLVDFISDDRGRANSGSLAYVAALLVGTWLIYYEALAGRMGEGMLGLYLGTFVAGQVLRAGVGAAQKVGEAKAARPAPEISPVKTATTQADTSVTPE